MRKFVSVICVAVLLLFSSAVQAQQQAQSKEQLLHDTLITALDPYIRQGIINYYGYPKSYALFWTKILDIKRESKGGYSFIVKVQAKTYEHAHSSPIGIETITMNVSPSGVKVTSYEHKGDEWEQKIKKFKNDIVMDIQKTFHLDLTNYQKYEYEQLLSQAEQKGLEQLAKFNEDIVIKELNKDIKPPYKNVAYPFTFVKDDKA